MYGVPPPDGKLKFPAVPCQKKNGCAVPKHENQERSSRMVRPSTCEIDINLVHVVVAAAADAAAVAVAAVAVAVVAVVAVVVFLFVAVAVAAAAAVVVLLVAVIRSQEAVLSSSPAQSMREHAWILS